jgi:prepilin-type N-terminal cleavage/methylation domain-containing protein
MSIKPTRKYWITLIEVLIAIYIFWIWILIILRMLISNISRLYDIRTKDTAVSLAKEAMDIVFHLRDSNIEKWMDWDCVEISYDWSSWDCDTNLLSWTLTRYQIDRSLTGLYFFNEIWSTGNSTIWYHTWIWYTQDWTSYTWFWYDHKSVWGIETPFFRRIEIFPHPTYPTYTNRVLWVRSIVHYTRWSTSKQVILESSIGDMR